MLKGSDFVFIGVGRFSFVVAQIKKKISFISKFSKKSYIDYL